MLKLPENTAQRLKELADLKDGWLDGHGVALSDYGLSSKAQCLSELQENSIAPPMICLLEDGNISLEWSTVDTPSLDLDFKKDSAYFHVAKGSGLSVEMDIPFVSLSDAKILSLLATLIH